jgi:LysR family pca operon transcriptional activator
MAPITDQRVRLRHLRTFLEVARQESIGRAAGALHISQPAVTKAVQELEEILGASLFHREGRRVRLTAAGEVFLPHAGQALLAVRRGIESVTAGASGPPIRIGALPTAAARIMPAAVLALMREAPAPSLRIVTGENAVLLEQLRSGGLDLVVGRLAEPERMTGFFFEHLYSERVVFVVRPGHPLTAPGKDLFARIGAFPMLLPSPGSIIRPIVERFMIARAMHRPAVVIETVSDSFGRAFLRASDATWVISEGVVADDLAEGSLSALPLDTRDTSGSVGFTRRIDVSPPPGLEKVTLAIRQAAPVAKR